MKSESERFASAAAIYCFSPVFALHVCHRNLAPKEIHKNGTTAITQICIADLMKA